MDKYPRKQTQQRIFIIQILLVGCISLLGVKSFDIQVFKARGLTQKAEQGYSKYLTIKGERGQILDRHLNKLGTSIDAHTITADPTLIKDPEDAAARISTILKIDPLSLKEKLTQKRRFTIIAQKVPPPLSKQVRSLNIQGLYFETDSKRFYPQRELASQVIGFTGKDDAGLEGLEFKYNTLLEGAVVTTRVKRDGAGRVLDIHKQRREELKGNSLVLTIDKKIQFLSEKTLENTVKEFQAKSGMVLVMKPATGELLAIAHYPGFNPNNFKAFPRDSYRNRAMNDTFEPGSILKVFTLAAGLEKGLTPQSTFFCENGRYAIGRSVVRDTHPHGVLSISQILQVSSNIGAVKISETIGHKALHDYLTGFGFGMKPGVGFPGEVGGSLLPHKQWTKLDAGAIAFGQAISVSALQLISGISAIANEGILMKPMLVKKIISNTGKEIKVFTPTQLHQVISQKTADQVKLMMNMVVQEEGTGTKAAMEGYGVCGKTSTAQKASKEQKGYEKNKYISAFVGFAPLENPELAILVVVDEPRNKHYGGEVAAPAFKTIMTESFNYLNIPPGKPQSMIAALAKEEKN